MIVLLLLWKRYNFIGKWKGSPPISEGSNVWVSGDKPSTLPPWQKWKQNQLFFSRKAVFSFTFSLNLCKCSWISWKTNGGAPEVASGRHYDRQRSLEDGLNGKSESPENNFIFRTIIIPFLDRIDDRSYRLIDREKAKVPFETYSTTFISIVLTS